jgi:hypothetical protein
MPPFPHSYLAAPCRSLPQAIAKGAAHLLETFLYVEEDDVVAAEVCLSSLLPFSLARGREALSRWRLLAQEAAAVPAQGFNF